VVLRKRSKTFTLNLPTQRNIMYATKKQLLNLLAILDKSCTKDDDDMDHRHGLFDSTDRGLMEDMRIELEEEIAEQPTNQREIL
jgi:hypothetical protein